MPKHRSFAERVGQLSCFDASVGHRPKCTAGNVERDQHAQLILRALSGAGVHGATRFELARQLGLMDNTVGPRLSDLRREGYIRKTEALRDGAIVWVVA
jgi:DNA-binding HxlR family transcriptional regulator